MPTVDVDAGVGAKAVQDFPRIERRHLAFERPRAVVWRGWQHRQVQQCICGSEASAQKDTGGLWA